MDGGSNLSEENPKRVPKALYVFLEERLKLSPIPFDSLQNDSDWTFVIKLHTYIEASLNHLIVSHFKDERLYPIISKLDVSDQTKGKLAFVKALDLLPDEYRSFIKQLSEIRNGLVHKAENLDYSLKKYVAKLDKQQRENLWKALESTFSYIGKWEPAILDHIIKNMPRHALHIGVSCIMLEINRKTNS